MEKEPSFKVSIEEEQKYKSLDWQSVGVGVFVGFILTLIFNWYMTRNDRPYDWCSYLPKDKSAYCIKLYDQATKGMQQYSDYQNAQQDGAFPDDGFR